MRTVKRIFDFYINASVHVALAVVSLYFVTVCSIDSSTNWCLMGFLGLGTIACYNFIKYGIEAEKYLIVANPYHKIIQIFSVPCLLGALLFFLKLDRFLWLPIAFLSVFSLLYALPFMPKAKNLRSLGGMKVFLVALVWAGCTVLLPILDAGKPFVLNDALLLLQRFLLILILLVPFEIRDLKYDDESLRTFPQRYGVPKTKTFGYLLIGFFMGLGFFSAAIHEHALWVQLLIFVLLLVVVRKASKDEPACFSSFYVEGIPILYALLTFLGMVF